MKNKCSKTDRLINNMITAWKKTGIPTELRGKLSLIAKTCICHNVPKKGHKRETTFSIYVRNQNTNQSSRILLTSGPTGWFYCEYDQSGARLINPVFLNSPTRKLRFFNRLAKVFNSNQYQLSMHPERGFKAFASNTQSNRGRRLINARIKKNARTVQRYYKKLSSIAKQKMSRSKTKDRKTNFSPTALQRLSRALGLQNWTKRA